MRKSPWILWLALCGLLAGCTGQQLSMNDIFVGGGDTLQADWVTVNDAFADEWGNEWTIEMRGEPDVMAPYLDGISREKIDFSARPMSSADMDAYEGEDLAQRGDLPLLAYQDPEEMTAGAGSDLEMRLTANLIRLAQTGPHLIEFTIDPSINRGGVQVHSIGGLANVSQVRVSFRSSRGSVRVNLLGQQAQGGQGLVRGTLSRSPVPVRVTGLALDNYYILSGAITVR